MFVYHTIERKFYEANTEAVDRQLGNQDTKLQSKLAIPHTASQHTKQRISLNLLLIQLSSPIRV